MISEEEEITEEDIMEEVIHFSQEETLEGEEEGI